MDQGDDLAGQVAVGADEAILHGAFSARPAREPRTFAAYEEDTDDGALNEQEHDRRAHAHAQECVDCGREVIKPSRLSPREDMSASDAL